MIWINGGKKTVTISAKFLLVGQIKKKMSENSHGFNREMKANNEKNRKI